jgi:hypothetical protein
MKKGIVLACVLAVVAVSLFAQNETAIQSPHQPRRPEYVPSPILERQMMATRQLSSITQQERILYQSYEQITVVSSSLGIVFSASALPAKIVSGNDQIIIVLPDETRYEFSGGEYQVIATINPNLSVSLSDLDLWVYGQEQ